jgi:hypothetical protein
LRADLLHGPSGEVVARDHLAVSRRQGLDGIGYSPDFTDEARDGIELDEWRSGSGGTAAV